MATKKRRHGEYTVGWICALPKEQTAAIAMLDEIHPDLPTPANDENSYSLGSIGKHNVVITCLPAGWIGTNQTARVASQMLSTFHSIKIGLMVGIGGGVPPSVRLGDVVVSTEWVQWDFGKLKEGHVQRTGKRSSPPTTLLSAVSKLRSSHDLNGTKISEYLEELKTKWPSLASKYTSVEGLRDPLPFNSLGTPEVIQAKDPKDVRIHYGVVASGNHVIKDAKSRDSINHDLGGDILCFEMEAAGLLGFPYIIVRGICDYADSQKNDEWQTYAAAVAAAYAKELLGCVLPYTIENEIFIKDAMPQILAEIEKAMPKIEQECDPDILNWFTEIDYGPQHHDYLSIRQEGTGQWLLKSPEFQAWLNSDKDQEKRVLFCPGIPGAGKTIITATVIDHLSKLLSNDPTIGIAYVYFNYKRQEDQELDKLLMSLLKQLVQRQPSIPESALRLFKDHNKGQEKSRPTTYEIIQTLSSVIKIHSRVFFVIDALDECQSERNVRGRFISELLRFQAQHGLNIFATSRNISEIADRFDGCGRIEIFAHEEDLRKYLDEEILQSGKRLLRRNDQEIKLAMVKAVDGVFLLAKLHFEAIRTKFSIKDIITTLESLPSGYESAYEGAMERIQHHDTESKDKAFLILAWIVCAVRPLSTIELQWALAVEIGKPESNARDLPDISDVISLCAGLVTIDEGRDVVRLVHYTTQEYFETTWQKWFPNAHIDITNICVTILLYDNVGPEPVQVQQSQAPRQGSGSDPKSKDNSSKLFPSNRYAFNNWDFHARKAPRDPSSISLLMDFLGNIPKVSRYLSILPDAKQRRMVFHTRDNGLNKGLQNIPGFHLAAFLGLYHAVDTILKTGNSDVDVRDEAQAGTPLMWACLGGQKKVIQLLLDSGADRNSRTPSGDTPLVCAFRYRYTSILELLLEAGADPNSKSEVGEPSVLLIAIAVERNDIPAIKLLIKHKTDLESKDGFGNTALALAARLSSTKAIEILLESGANLEAKDANGQTPLAVACSKPRQIHLLDSIRLLIKRGADIESKDINDRTPLLLAVFNAKSTEIIKFLIDNGANLNAKDRWGQTPLSRAVAYHASEEVVKLLLDSGSDIESKDSGGRTILSVAIQFVADLSIVKFLIENGADMTKEDDKGKSPLSSVTEAMSLTNVPDDPNKLQIYRRNKEILNMIKKKQEDNERKKGEERKEDKQKKGNENQEDDEKKNEDEKQEENEKKKGDEKQENNEKTKEDHNLA